jgi:xylulose-5-phosphate/fructose-6-phosphate phosphoketolase
MIVLRTPKGWTGPKEVDGLPVEGTWRSHEVPLAAVRNNAEDRRQLVEWLMSYGPRSCSTPTAGCCPSSPCWRLRASGG